MSNLFIVFTISLTGGVAAILTAMLFTALTKRKPEKPVTMFLYARYEAGLWNVYYEDEGTDTPLRVATFADVRDAEYLLTRVQQFTDRIPGAVDEPAVPITDDYCDARR